MLPNLCNEQAPVPPPSYSRREVQAQAERARALHIHALTLIETLHPAFVVPFGGSVGASALSSAPAQRPRRSSSHLQRGVFAADRCPENVVAAVPTWDVHDGLAPWPALARACGLPVGDDGQPRIPSPSQLCNRWQAAGAPLFESLFVLTVWRAVGCRLIGARDLIIDSAPLLAWRRADPEATVGHAPAHHPRPLLRGYRVHTLLCRGSGWPVHFLVWPAHAQDAPFARPLLEGAVRLSQLRPRIIRLDAGYWGLQLIHWIHATLGALAVVPWNPKRQKNRSCLPPTWTKEEVGKRTSIERFVGHVFRFFGLQRPPFSGWSAIVRQVALTYTASIIVSLVAWQAHRPDLIRSPKRVLAHLWADSE